MRKNSHGPYQNFEEAWVVIHMGRYFTPSQYEELEAEAKRRGISNRKLIKELIPIPVLPGPLFPKPATVPMAKAMRVVGMLKRDRAQWRKAFHRENNSCDSLEEDYRRTLGELNSMLAVEDIQSAREVIAGRLETFD